MYHIYMKELFKSIVNIGKIKEAPQEKEHSKNGTGNEQKESGKIGHQKYDNGQEQKAAGV